MNKRVLIGLGVVAVAVLAFWPGAFGVAAPLLFLAACPLSMVFMMRSMSGGQRNAASEASPAETSPSPSGAVPAAGGTPQTRELEEEVGRLRAELHLRDQRSTS
ncbi:MAG: DUF2933 domain-containing protein [Actinomycetota bacterium]|nr:DUF2933 domain-containing protein [Actinomycetota bacterium]